MTVNVTVRSSVLGVSDVVRYAMARTRSCTNAFVAAEFNVSVSRSPFVTMPSFAVPLDSEIVANVVDPPVCTFDPESVMPLTSEIDNSSAASLLAVIWIVNVPPFQSPSPSRSFAVAAASIRTGLPPSCSSV